MKNKNEKQYFSLRSLINDGDVWISEYNYKAESSKNVSEIYSDGISFNFKYKPIELHYKYKTANKTDFIEGIHSFPIVSDRFKQLLVEHNVSDIEFYPVKLICLRTGEVDSSYWLLNILNNIDCFDWKNSDYETIPGFDNIIMTAKSISIEMGKIKHRDIVRMGEMPTIILINEKLKEIIEEKDLTGIKFKKNRR